MQTRPSGYTQIDVCIPKRTRKVNKGGYQSDLGNNRPGSDTENKNRFLWLMKGEGGGRGEKEAKEEEEQEEEEE